MDNIEILVNKANPIYDYVPTNLIKISNSITDGEKYLQATAYQAIIKLINDAKRIGLYIKIVSAYRSYDYQEELFARYTDQEGYLNASKSSAYPGFSEHQTGLAVDLADNTGNYQNFIYTKEYQWIKNNAHKYGYILRYPQNKSNITGYIYEPWHFRYVGNKLAHYIYYHNITLEEYKKKKC